jgi:dTDP-4-dehydrorhamnose reductase
MKIVLIGADGQLGSDLFRRLGGEEVFPLYYPDFDVTQPERTRHVLSRIAPEIVINTAAYHRVDDCEDHPRESFLVNAVAVRDLAVICRDLSAALVHFSTDYVFDGRKQEPYVEEDPPNPLNVYALSKLAGEILVRQTLPKYFLIRTCGLYGEAGCKEKGTNFVERIIELDKLGKTLRIVNDQRVTPTSTDELAERLSALIRTRHYGLYHLTNEGDCTWYEFAQEVFSLLGKGARISPVDSESYGAQARRPLYSVLENKKAKEVGLRDFSHWKGALKDYLRKRGYAK